MHAYIMRLMREHGRRGSPVLRGCSLTSAPVCVNPAHLQSPTRLFSGSASFGGASVQAQPHQPDGQRDGVPADGVRRGGETSPPPFLVQRQPASPPNVRCVKTPTPGVAHSASFSRPLFKQPNFLLLYTFTRHHLEAIALGLNGFRRYLPC